MNRFIPKNYKFRKIRKRVRIKNVKDYKLNTLKYGSYGLKVLENATVSSTTLEACRVAINKRINKVGMLRINGYPNIPITTKSLGVRMGKGSGNISEWTFSLKKGRILFEINKIPYDLAKAALKSADQKLSFRTKFVSLPHQFLE